MTPGALNILNYCLMLSHIFKIYVPSTTDVNTPTDNAEKVRNTLVFLSDMFGGATATPARGAWVSNSAGLVLEDVTICYAFCTLGGKLRNRRRVMQYAARLRDEMKQEAISVEIDGRLYFV